MGPQVCEEVAGNSMQSWIGLAVAGLAVAGSVGMSAEPAGSAPSASALILVSHVQKSTVQNERPSGPSGASAASSAAWRCSSTRFWWGARPAQEE